MDLDPVLVEKYSVEDKGDKWHLFCKICNTGFSLKKTSDGFGNVLSLLNHSTGCEADRESRRNL